MSDVETDYQAAPRGSRVVYYALFGMLGFLLACNIYLFWRMQRMRAEIADWRASTLTEISQLRESFSSSSTQSHQNVELLRQELDTARRQAARAAGQAKIAAQKHAERLTRKLAKQQESELSEIKTTTNTKITDVSNEVAATKSELAKTASDLKRAMGDMGVMSGLIATNSAELATLKQLGGRNYFEFSLRKGRQPHKVGDISLVVKKTDPRRNKYTIEVLADDKRVEKKDKNINEPVQFYVSKAWQPYEIVVNDVRKDQLVGYLAAPKVQVARK